MSGYLYVWSISKQKKGFIFGNGRSENRAGTNRTPPPRVGEYQKKAQWQQIRTILEVSVG